MARANSSSITRNLGGQIAGSDISSAPDEGTATYIIPTDRLIPGCLAPATLKLRISETKKTFLPVKTFKHVMRILDQFGHVMICGVSGEGKTAMSLMLARDYLKKGYEVVFVENIHKFDFNECISSTQRFILILDDIFGSVGLTTDTSHLKTLISSIQTHIRDCKQQSIKSHSKRRSRKGTRHPTDASRRQESEHKEQKDIRAVFTSKTYNFKDGVSKLQYERLSMFTGYTVVDLTTNKDHSYSDEEKIAIFEKHKKVNPGVETDDLTDQDLLTPDRQLFGYPLTCRLFFEFASFSNSTKEFFQRPLFYLKLELNDLLNQNNNQTAALILMLLCEDKLDLAELERESSDGKMDGRIKTVTEIVPSATRSGIATAVRNFRGTFFSSGDIITFAHPSIYDACACAMYNINPTFVLQNCSIDFMYERLKPGSVEEAKATDHRHFLFVSESYYDLIATRFVEEMTKGHFSKTLTHPLLKNESFTHLMLKIIKSVASRTFPRKPKWILQKDEGKGILFWAVQGHSDQFVQDLDSILNTSFTDEEIRESLDGCVEKDSLPLLNFLLNKLKEKTHPLINKKLLLLCGQKGSLEIAQHLLREGTDINTVDEEKQNFIHLVCRYGKSAMLSSLNSNIGSFIRRETYLSGICSIDIQGRTPAMLAAMYGQWDCFKLISDVSDLGIKDKSGYNIIHLAAIGGNRDIVQHVLTPSNINNRGRYGRTPVMIAAVCGQQSVFDSLVSHNADLTLVDDRGDSLLHLACEGGNRDIVQHVLTPSNINSRGKNGRTPVMIAAVWGKQSVFDFLVSHNADITLMADSGDSLLHLACEGGDRDIVQHVLTPSNINSRGKNGRTPVMIAAVWGKQSVFDFLVSHNADLSLVDDSGNSLLHLACLGGDRDIVQHVLTPSNINSRGKNGRTPVMIAAVWGQQSVFDFLVSHNADLTLVDDSGNSLLHLACEGGDRDIVHVLTPSNINSRGKNGRTPVMIAAVCGQQSVFDFLVSHNADLTLVDDSGDSLLHLACEGGNRDIVQHVLTPSNINNRGRHGRTPVMIAAVSGQQSVFDFLVSHNADITLMADSGDSLLHLACEGGDRDIVQHVLTPSNINSRGKNGRTPVMIAAVWGKQSVFDFLVSHNADLSLVDDSGNSLLHLACEGGDRDIVQHVLTPSNINSRGKNGRIPVMIAAVWGQQSVFDFLVSHNADITLVDDSGDSLLHLACEGGDRDIVQRVLTPSNINSRGKNGRTPVMIAAVWGQQSVFDFLVSHNADLTLVDDSGNSLLHLACEGGDRDIVHVLTPSNINSRGKNGRTPVMIAAVWGKQSVFDFLVSHNADLSLVDDSGNSLLHLACLGGDRDIVQHVLTPSNINSRGKNGRIPVMIAAVWGKQSVFDFLVSHKWGKQSVFDFLVSHNADLTLVDDSGNSLLHLACEGGDRDIVHVLTPSNINNRGRHGWTPVMIAAVSGQQSVFDFLVSHNADITLMADSGDSLLHLACEGGDRDIVQHVLTPSNINSRGKNDRTPVMIAAVWGKQSVFDFLVSHNADLSLVDDSGNSLLHLACLGGDRDIVQHVLTPSNINSRGKNGRTPVMIAAVSGQQSVFDFLVSHNADLTLVDDSGDSLLHLACEGGDRDIVQHVLTPSNINNRGRHGRTPVMIAAVSGQQSVFDFLVSHNADITLVDDSGDSLLHLAYQGGNRDIVQHVLTHSNINSRG